MDYLGEVEVITNDGKIIVRAETAPSGNGAVFDSRERRVGTIKRVFGPVDSPYVTVVPVQKGDLNGLVNKKLFYRMENQNNRSKGRHYGRN